MKDKLLKKLLWGFALGAVSGILITGLINLMTGRGFSIATEELIREAGRTSAIAMQLLLCGIYGAICFGGTIFYEIESWGLLRATVSHYLCILASFSLTGFLLRWLHFDAWSAFFILAITVVFFVIWLVMGAIWRKNIREMNSELETYRKENNK